MNEKLSFIVPGAYNSHKPFLTQILTHTIWGYFQEKKPSTILEAH